jgi:hypothetical protein
MTIHFDQMTEQEVSHYVIWLIDDYAKNVARKRNRLN